MRPTSVSVSSQAASAWVPLDHRKAPFSASLAVTIGSATLTYKVQHTYDDIQDASVTPVAFDHPDITGETTNQDGSYERPVRAVRLNVTAYTSGTATLTVIQAG